MVEVLENGPQAVGVPPERGRRGEPERRHLRGTKTGRFAIVEQLLADGITYMFGNPGTVEQGFLDALGSYPDMRYITTLQETIAVGDGRRLRPRDAEADASSSCTAASGSATGSG